MLQPILNLDKQLLLFLHSKGSIQFDFFWVFITNPIHWIPLVILILFGGFKVFKFNKTIGLFFIISLSSVISLLIVNLIKNTVQRLRPINDPSINESIRSVLFANDFSFVSGHSAVSFTITFLSYWILKNHYRFAFLLFLFPLLFAYSRIYLALHFPLDIIAGALLGYVIACITYKITDRYLRLNSF